MLVSAPPMAVPKSIPMPIITTRVPHPSNAAENKPTRPPKVGLHKPPSHVLGADMMA